jgi:deoxyribose-phosphate aldolase
MLGTDDPGFMTVETLARQIDHTLLRPDHTVEDLDRVCQEAIGYGFASVAVSPYDVPRAVEALRGTDVAVGGAVGIPLGHAGLQVKQAEAAYCVESGAAEVDMVINLIAMKSGRFGDVRDEMAAIREVTTGLVLKVILECCYLSDEEKARAAELALETGADFVKTSTGFGPGGATVHDVKLLKQVVGDLAKVKAAGGIRTLKDVRDMLHAGAARIGTSAGVDIIQEFQKSRMQDQA